MNDLAGSDHGPLSVIAFRPDMRGLKEVGNVGRVAFRKVRIAVNGKRFNDGIGPNAADVDYTGQLFDLVRPKRRADDLGGTTDFESKRWLDRAHWYGFEALIDADGELDSWRAFTE